MKITPKPVKVFSREAPCSKVDLANCLLAGGQAVERAVVEARGEIGLNAIKYLRREGYAEAYHRAGVDWWKLTPEGVEWLAKGLARHLELHPDDAALLAHNPGVSRARRRRPAR